MKIKNIVFGIAIIILTMFVTVYGINTFYERPEYENFCKEDFSRGATTEKICIDSGGRWNSYDVSPKPEGIGEGYCDLTYTCRQEYEEADKIYSRNVFFIALPLGILVILLGAYFFSLEAVGAGLMGGGVGTLIYGAGGYWRYAENWLRFILSLIGLVVLIWFVYWFNKRSEKKR